MAAGTRLQLKFETMSGLKTWNFTYGKPGAGATNVKALAQAMINNGEIYENQPIRVTSIKEITTSETVYDLDS